MSISSVSSSTDSYAQFFNKLEMDSVDQYAQTAANANAEIKKTNEQVEQQENS